MGMRWDEAVAAATGPGGPFEIAEADVLGRRTKVFAKAPPSLRALFDGARSRGGEIFLVYEDERWSFAETMAKVDALGAALVARYGVAPGDRVAIAMRNYPEWVVAFAAITSVGAISVSMNAWWTADELDYALGDCGAQVVVADAERSARIAPLAAKHGFRTIAVRTPAPLPSGADAWDDVVRPGAALPPVEIHPDMDATILYTSGTTGHPKGAVSTHRAVLSAVLAFGCRAWINAAIGQGPPKDHPFPTSFILIVPLFHVTGCVAVMLSCLAAGKKLVVMYKWDPARALELVERERITNFVGVPTQSWDLLECPDFARRDTSSLLSVGGGGAPAPPELVRRVDKSFRAARPSIGYGMTETNAYGPGNSADDYVRKPTSCGRVVPVAEMRVTDPDGRVLGPDEVGELWFRGPMLIRGYWNRPEATAETIVDGWLRSGDVGRIDDEGFVYVQDRAKDMVLRAGENVYCAEVEAALYEHPDVYEAAVFGVPHERLGEEVAAAVVPKPGRAIDADALRGFLAEHLAPFKVPTRIDVSAAALPRNPAGKVLKRALRDGIVAGRARPS
ncbi:MAG: fatty acid--CoA ligase [Proteobacteria bacterium]|nr:MAG: fatty acid--CoA ligase [Pseudomonadota bacterium]